MRRPASTPSAAELTLRIERVGADGDGVGFVAPDAIPAEAAMRREAPFYIPLTLSNETIRARVSGVRGEVLDILEASPERVAPPCAHFGACGGCALQHWNTGAIAAWKGDLVAAALRRAGFEDPLLRPPICTPRASRRRLDLALRRAGGRALIGLHRPRGGEVVDIAACAVARPELVALIAPLRALLTAGSFVKREGSAAINLLDSGPDLLLRTDAEPTVADRAALIRFARAHGLPRIAWARGTGAPEPVCVLRPPTIRFSGIEVTPPPGAFLQASHEGERAIVATVLGGLPASLGARERIIELHAGCGTITFALAARARVAAFDADPAAIGTLRQAANRAGLAGRITATQRDLARQPLSAQELSTAPALVLDPPFAGAREQMQAIAASQPACVIYVSCNPAALARDLRILREGGYRLVLATPIDQFLWSARVEAVCVLAAPEHAKGRKAQRAS